MRKMISHTNGDYIVCVEVEQTGGLKQFRPLRNFGCRLSDAIEYRDSDLEGVSESRLKFLLKTYKANVRYKRVFKENGSVFYRKTDGEED